MAGQVKESTITSLARWDGGHAGQLFVMYPVARMDEVAVTHISAFRVPLKGMHRAQPGLTMRWCANFPTSPTDGEQHHCPGGQVPGR